MKEQKEIFYLYFINLTFFHVLVFIFIKYPSFIFPVLFYSWSALFLEIIMESNRTLHISELLTH